jgi:hypothetical protein
VAQAAVTQWAQSLAVAVVVALQQLQAQILALLVALEQA